MSYNPNQQPFADNDPRYRCCCNCCGVRTAAIIIATLHAVGFGAVFYFVGKFFLSVFMESNYWDWRFVLVFSIAVTFFVWGVIALATLFVGLCLERPKLLFPQLTLLIVLMIVFFLYVVGVVLVLAIWLDKVIIGIEDLKDDFERETRTGKYSRQFRFDGHEFHPYGNQYEPFDPYFFDSRIGRRKPSEETRHWSVLILSISLASAIISLLIELWWFLVVRSCYKYLQEKNLWKQNANVIATGNGSVAGGVPAAQSYKPTQVTVTSATGNGSISVSEPVPVMMKTNPHPGKRQEPIQLHQIPPADPRTTTMAVKTARDTLPPKSSGVIDMYGGVNEPLIPNGATYPMSNVKI